MICLHVGSTRRRRHAAGRADGAARRDAVRPALARRRARSGCGRGTAVQHPDLKIVMSEGGIGWVAMLHDRLENIVDRSGLRPLLRAGRSAPGRGAAPQLLVLHDRRPVDALDAATPSASTTSCSRPTTRTATAPGPTARQVFARRVRRAPAGRDRQDQPRERGRLFRHPLPAARLPPRRRPPPVR